VAAVTSDDPTINSRLLFAHESLTSFWSDGGAQRIVLGWGWDNYVFFWQKHYDPKIFYYDAAIADRAHNKLIDMLVMTGLAGLVAYLIVWGIFIARIIARVKADLSGGLALLFYAAAYGTFLFFEIDIPLALLGFYAILALTSFQSYEPNA
jgi:O-antigen ligase